MQKISLYTISFAITFLASFTQTASLLAQSSRFIVTVEEQIEIDSVWAANRVNFSLLTSGKHQFVAYYDKNRMMTVASRLIGDVKWHKITLPNKLRWDSHNYVTLGIDQKGYLHVSGNMHVNPLAYYRTEKPLDINSFKELNRMVGKEEDRVTYPKFFNDKDGSLYFSYRTGSSGNGNVLVNRFDPEKKIWRRYISSSLFDGMTDTNSRSAYHTFTRDVDGNFHYVWMWRLTPKVETSHQLCYATSPDLINWTNAAGESISLPFMPNDTRLIVDNTPPLGGMHNGRYQIIISPEKKPLIGYVKYDEHGKTQLFVAAFNGHKWQSIQVSNWDFRWEFIGGGDEMTQGGDFSLEGFSDEGFLLISWNTEKGDSGLYTINPQTLQKITIQTEVKPKYAAIVKSKLSDNPEMTVRLSRDHGQSKQPNINYILKWETMPQSHGAHAPKVIPSGPLSPLLIIKSKIIDTQNRE